MTLEDLEKDAAHWLQQVQRKNPGPLKRLRRSYPDAPADPALADIQHALARERGYANWDALTAAITAPAASESSPAASETDQAAARFLEFACWDHRVHGRGDYAMTETAAMRTLHKHPEVARYSLSTAVVCGDLDEVERILDERPELVDAKGGFRRWEPLLYLCYARLPLDTVRRNAVPIARSLLDRGANPNAYYMAGDAVYGTLVGVAGEGEQDAPPHRDRDTLYQFLLERGAEPFDIQVLYNTHFHGDVLWWLEMTCEYTVRTGQGDAWKDPDWPMLDMGGYGCGARFLLWIAIRQRDAALASWLLAHGANPNAPPARHPTFSKRSLYEDAVRAGCRDIADLLVKYGADAHPVVLDEEERFVEACFRLDRGASEAMLLQHPEFRQSPKALHEAAKRDRDDVVALLLDLGIWIEAENERRQHALHLAAGHHALRVAELLVERGAEIDPRETNWDNTPLDFAVYGNDREMIDFLSPYSRDVWCLAFCGKIDRLRQVLAEQPELARAKNRTGLTTLWWLPDDERAAVEVVDLLIAHGADPSVRSQNGTTAADYARKRGLDAAAARIEAAVPPA
jgi:uncharacterized protein